MADRGVSIVRVPVSTSCSWSGRAARRPSPARSTPTRTPNSQEDHPGGLRPLARPVRAVRHQGDAGRAQRRGRQLRPRVPSVVEGRHHHRGLPHRLGVGDGPLPRQRHPRRDGRQNEPTAERGVAARQVGRHRRPGQLQARLRERGPPHPRREPAPPRPVRGIQIYPKDGRDWASTAATDYHSTSGGAAICAASATTPSTSAPAAATSSSTHPRLRTARRPQPWFEGEWDRTTLERDVWDPNWLYLHKENTAPLLIGEWGGFMDGAPTRSG